MGYKISVLLLLLFAGGAAVGQRAIHGYFPYGAVEPGQPRLDSFELALYSIKLTGLKVPVLYGDSSQAQTYRFTWLPFFGPAMAMRLERRGLSVKLYWKESKANEETEPGKLIHQGHRTLSMSEWKTFIQKLDSLDF